MRARLRAVAAVVLVAFLATLAAPIVEAQFVYDSNGGIDDQQFISTVNDTLASGQRDEQAYLDAQARGGEASRAAQELRAMSAPPGVDQAQWSSMVDQRANELGTYQQQNDSLLQRTKDRLSSYYEKLTGFGSRIASSANPEVQKLGTLIGAAGVTTVPIWSRPTIKGPNGIVDAAQTMFQRTRMATVKARVGDGTKPGPYQNWSTARGASATKAAAAVENLSKVEVAWVPKAQGEGAAAKYVLEPQVTNGTYAAKPHETSIKANQETAAGTFIENPAAKQYALDMASMKTAQTKVNIELTRCKQLVVRETNEAVKNGLDKRIKSLESTRTQLDADIKAWDASHPSLGQQAKQLGVNAAKWAATSMAITYGADVVDQLIANGWNIGGVDWKRPLGTFKSKEFWGGTGGSFVGSLAGSALGSLIPGGGLMLAGVRTLLAVGGASVGWQFGSGNWRNTDWTQLLVTTVGSTVGLMVGSALLGPFGAIVGGIVGSLVSDWALRKFREWRGTPYAGSSRPDESGSYAASQSGPSGYAGLPSADGISSQSRSTWLGIGGSSGSGAGAAGLDDERRNLMTEFQAVIGQNPPDLDRAKVIRERLVAIDGELGSQRAAGSALE